MPGSTSTLAGGARVERAVARDALRRVRGQQPPVGEQRHLVVERRARARRVRAGPSVGAAASASTGTTPRVSVRPGERLRAAPPRASAVGRRSLSRSSSAIHSELSAVACSATPAGPTAVAAATVS